MSQKVNRHFHAVILCVTLAAIYFCGGGLDISFAAPNSGASLAWPQMNLALVTKQSLSSSFLLQIFGGVVILTALVLGAVAFSKHRKTEQRLRLRDTISHILAEAETLAEARPKILRTLCEMDGWNAGMIWNVGDGGNKMVCAEIWCDSSLNPAEFENLRHCKFTRDSGLLGRICQTGEIIWTTDIAADPFFSELSGFHKKWRSAFFVPLKLENKVIGILVCFSRYARRPQNDFLRMLATMGAQIGQFIRHMRTQADLQRLTTIVADSEDAIISMTLDGTIVTWNKAAQRIYGFSSEEAIGHSTDIVFPPVSADKMSQFLESVGQGKKVANYETLCRRKNGSLFEISLTVSPISDALGQINGASVIARDVSERRRLEREVLEISAHERRRISYELHDGLSQHLAGIAFKAKSLQISLVEEETAHTGAAHEIVELVNDAMRQTRQVARNLDPIEIEASGLVTVLEQFCIETGTVFRVNCQFQCKEHPLPLEAQTNLALFRIAQEAIRNALVHGGPEKIEVRLFVENGRLYLTIYDDGKGFDLTKKSSGVGLRLMQYRAHTIDATFQLSSKPGAGTLIQCSLPFFFRPPKPEEIVHSLAQDDLVLPLKQFKKT